MENTVYHDYIQGIKQLDLTREVRFSDFKRHTILDALGISSGDAITFFLFYTLKASSQCIV